VDGIYKLTSIRMTELSPPLGLKKLNRSDGDYLEKVTNDMIVKHLAEFERTCFRSEGDKFKREITKLMCSLYTSLENGFAVSSQTSQ